MKENEFIEELKKINIEINELQLLQLEKYYELLVEYNQKFNLTSLTTKETVYLKHFYDSLTLNKVINLNEIQTLCDVGSGAGFPGIVLKIMYPNIKVTLIDSTSKKIMFLNTVINELKLSNIQAKHCRVEEFVVENREKFDIVTARAVAKLNILTELCTPLVKVNGHFISMKGNISLEIKNIDRIDEFGLMIDKIEEFLLPFEESMRTIISFKKLKPTSTKYPRRYNEILKKPLF